MESKNTLANCRFARKCFEGNNFVFTDLGSYLLMRYFITKYKPKTISVPFTLIDIVNYGIKSLSIANAALYQEYTATRYEYRDDNILSNYKPIYPENFLQNISYIDNEFNHRSNKSLHVTYSDAPPGFSASDGSTDPVHTSFDKSKKNIVSPVTNYLLVDDMKSTFDIKYVNNKLYINIPLHNNIIVTVTLCENDWCHAGFIFIRNDVATFYDPLGICPDECFTQVQELVKNFISALKLVLKEYDIKYIGEPGLQWYECMASDKHMDTVEFCSIWSLLVMEQLIRFDGVLDVQQIHEIYRNSIGDDPADYLLYILAYIKYLGPILQIIKQEYDLTVSKLYTH